MRRLTSILFQLVAAVVFVFLATAAWIVFDGLNDREDKVDVALVTGYGEATSGTSNPELDRVVDLYRQAAFPAVMVFGASWKDATSESGVQMVKYLEDHGLPPSALIVDNRGDTVHQEAHRAAEIMKAHDFKSVMIVANYYDITRTKLALSHDGVTQIESVHVGTAQKEDVVKVANEVVALYTYVGRTVLLPAAEKVKSEAAVGMDKASVDAQEEKQKVDKSLDSLAK
jgi:vancomycin permeability regulator SanA